MSLRGHTVEYLRPVPESAKVFANDDKQVQKRAFRYDFCELYPTSDGITGLFCYNQRRAPLSLDSRHQLAQADQGTI